ncbi:hypothetical protein E2C01_029162 [Portunus trituberculatus]|uniref:Uncharacterized protein n=1 Tax=Portunus trituberculatus TaxID=210409 RepID=A0A5B7ER23_PORTR|nr:hypothetical protein [Portunus trituberculatus]
MKCNAEKHSASVVPGEEHCSRGVLAASQPGHHSLECRVGGCQSSLLALTHTQTLTQVALCCNVFPSILALTDKLSVVSVEGSLLLRFPFYIGTDTDKPGTHRQAQCSVLEALCCNVFSLYKLKAGEKNDTDLL